AQLRNAGKYYLTTTANGCTHLDTVTVVINCVPVTKPTVSASICAGSTYAFYGRTLTTSGTYTDTLHTAGACDSVRVLSLSFSNTITDLGASTGSALTIDESFSNALSLANWGASTLTHGNGGSASVAAGSLQISVNGGSCGVCGVWDSRVLNADYSNLPTDLGASVFEFNINELQRQQVSGKHSVDFNARFYDKADQNSGINIALHGNYRGAVFDNSGRGYNTWNAHSLVISPVNYSSNTEIYYLDASLDLNTYYNYNFRLKYENGVWCVYFKTDSEIAYQKIVTGFTKSSSLQFSFLAGSGDGGGTSQNGSGSFSVDYFRVYSQSKALSARIISPVVCTGSASAIVLYNTQQDITYQLKSGNTPVGAAQPGGADSLTFPISALSATTGFTFAASDAATGCSITLDSIFRVTVNTVAKPTVTPSGPIAFCSGGGSVTLTPSPAFAYLWSNGATTQSITAATSGSYTVQTISNGCTSAPSDPVTVTVTSPPAAPVITPSGPVTIGAGGSVTLTAPAGFAYIWSNGAATQSISANAAGSYTVQTVIGGCTSAVSAAVQVTVITTSALISGRVYSPRGYGIPDASLLADEPAATQTDDDGNYSLRVHALPMVSLHPHKSNDTGFYNGVTTLDILLIHFSVIDSILLNSPYKRIAADVNNSGTVTTLDIDIIHDFILGNRDSFFGRLWAFVRHDQTFPTDPYEPFPYDSVRTYTTPSVDLGGQDFIGMRLGDVNYSWNPNIRRYSAPTDLHLGLPNMAASAGEDVIIPVTASDFNNIAGFQFTFGWHAGMARFDGLIPGAIADVKFGEKWKTQGMIGIQWDNPTITGLSFAPGTVLFSIRLHINSGLAENTVLPLFINGNRVPVEAVSGNLDLLGLPDAVGSVLINGLTGLQPGSTARPSLSASPNPFSEQTNIAYTLTGAGPASIRIYTILGTEVYAESMANAIPGRYSLSLSRANSSGGRLPAGTYICELQTKTGNKRISLVIQ
ncbi:MAG: T9SS type A sorting domain-containing protein, partial [Bacteroidota bacterium]